MYSYAVLALEPVTCTCTCTCSYSSVRVGMPDRRCCSPPAAFLKQIDEWANAAVAEFLASFDPNELYWPTKDQVLSELKKIQWSHRAGSRLTLCYGLVDQAFEQVRPAAGTCTGTGTVISIATGTVYSRGAGAEPREGLHVGREEARADRVVAESHRNRSELLPAAKRVRLLRNSYLYSYLYLYVYLYLCRCP